MPENFSSSGKLGFAMNSLRLFIASNNHSDAWFVGVTPKLVAGGWVGGEYRSIHFRTGALGQGSRTALPIFGRFIQSVLLDDRFSNYRAKFPKEPKEYIDPSTYTCSGVYIEEPDSLAAASDSLGILLPDSAGAPAAATIGTPHAPDSQETAIIY